MSVKNVLSMGLAGLAALMVAAPGWTHVLMHQPQKAQSALAVLNRVVNHSKRLIEAHNYEHLPRETNELKEAMEALAGALSQDSTDFKGTVTPLMRQAEASSEAVAAAARSHDDTKLASAQLSLAQSVETLINAFPASARPVPRDQTPPSGDAKRAAH